MMNKNGIDIEKLNRNVILDYLFTFIRNLDMSSSIWVLYLAYRGMSLLEVGLLEGIYHITSILFEIPSGAVADLLGRKKSVVAGRVCMTLSCVCMLFAGGFWGFALGFFIQALGNNLNSGSEEALLYDSMKLCGREEEFLKVSGRVNMLVEVSQAIAVVAGGILAEYSYVWCYAACIVIALLAIVTALFLTEAPVTEADGNEGVQGDNGSKPAVKDAQGGRLLRHFSISIGILRENERIRNIVIYYSTIFAAYTLLFFYSQQYFYDMGLNKVQISLIMLLAGGVSCLGAVCSEKLYGWLGDRSAGGCAIIIAVCIAAFGLHRLSVAVGALVLAGFCNSLLYPIQSISLNRLIPSGQRATLISVNSMAFSVGMVLIFPLVGALADMVGLPMVFLGLGVFLAVGSAAAQRMSL